MVVKPILFNETEIKKFLYTIFEDGDTIEVRCLDCKESRQQGVREGSIRGGF